MSIYVNVCIISGWKSNINALGDAQIVQTLLLHRKLIKQTLVLSY